MDDRARKLALTALAVALLALSLASAAPAGAVVPNGFEDTLVAQVSGPTEMAWTPDGRMLVTSKTGQLYVYDNGQQTLALDLAARMCTNGERALGGVAVHPNFAANRYVYLYYTYNKYGTCNESEVDGPVNRLSRFVLGSGSVVDPASETVLLDTPPLFRDHHNGGDLKFGKDGYLYATIGDGGSARFGWSQDTGRLLGKVIRITDSGGIPADNPFNGLGTARCNLNGVPPLGSASGTKCQEVYAQGLRNPFRFAFDPNAAGVRFFINDVGQHTWEEASLGQRGADYGWPVREGPCAKDSTIDCGPPPAGMTNPVWYYQHGPMGAAMTGGAFPPDGVWPAEFNGTYLYADYVFGKIYRLTPNGAGGFTQSEFATINGITSLRFGPYGSGQALYYATRDGSEIHRIAFTGSANRAPVAHVSANPSSGPAPLNVGFDGSASSDPDGDALTYEWDFENDGTTDATGSTAAHPYTVAGTYTAKLTVRDPSGSQGSATVRIDAGNTPPEPVIETPAEGTLFAVGDRFTLHGRATDAQNGPLGDASLSWEVIRHHATHTHPLLEPTTGNDIPIIGPEPEDLDAARTSYLEIRLTATDSSGLSATVTRDLRPKFVDVSFQTDPTGLNLNVSGATIAGPATVRSWENLDLTVNAPAQTDSSGRAWQFQSWSDGGSAAHTIRTPASAATYAATFRASETRVLTFTPSDDAYIRADSPTTSFGGQTALHADASPVENSLVRFAVSGIGSGTVSSAKLRLYCVDSSSSGGDLHRLSDPFASWSEGTVNWGNAPAANPATLASVGPVSTGNWYEVDVTPMVMGDGSVSVRITNASSNGADYSTKEGTAGFAPQLVVTVGGGSSGPAPDTSKPTAPAGLTPGAVTSSRVDLSWTASQDTVGVTGYEIFRDGSLYDTIGSLTSYSDTHVAPGTRYRYEVRARDAAGNRSDFSNFVEVTTPGSSSALTFTPTDDSYVKQSSPTSRSGSGSVLSVDGSPLKDILVRFSVSGVGTRTVASAKLRVHCVDGSSVGGDLRALADPLATWAESTVSWSNAPPAAAATTAALGRVLAGTWYELDVTSLVRGDGPVSFRVTSSNTNGADYASKEGAAGLAPQLVINAQ